MSPPRVVFLDECVGTAVLVNIGVPLVTLDFGVGRPVARLMPSPEAGRALTGFVFGSTGGLIAVSRVARLAAPTSTRS